MDARRAVLAVADRLRHACVSLVGPGSPLDPRDRSDEPAVVGGRRLVPDGGTEGADGTRTDAADRFADADRRFVALFENFPEPTVAYTYEGDEPVVVAVNAAFEEVFGYDAAAARGEVIDDLIVPPDRRDEAREIDERVETGEQVDEELKRETADGVRDFWFRNIEIDDDELDGFGVYADVTERKRGKRELERQNERLERFATVVSHDLRNPLNVAKSRLELTEQDAHVEKAMDALDRMETMIDDLLELARVGATVDEVTDVRIGATIENCWRNVETGDAALELDVDPDATIAADRTRLAQVFENLFRNAVEHSAGSATGASTNGDADPDARVTITVGLLPERNGFYVADDGPGIPERDRETVFEPGYSTVEGGSGLGLSIVRDIVEAHGWTIHVTESADGGARFEISGVDSL